MAKRNFRKEIRVMVDDGLAEEVKMVAGAKGKTVSEFVREALVQYTDLVYMQKMGSRIQAFVANAVEEKLKPVENRLAKITAKTAMAAVMTMYVEAALLGRHEKDVVNIFREARQKAIAFVQSGIPNTGQLEHWAKNAAKGDEN